MATYTKLKNGEWGIRVEGTVRKGDLVTVTKKSGQTKTETVAKVLWTGNGVCLCAIRRKASYETRQSFARSPARRSSGCCAECGTLLERWMDGYAMGLCHDCL
jgi:hypothetical protein